MSAASPRPFISWPVIADAFRPGREEASEASIRTLRRRHLVTKGIAIRVRHNGRLAGSMHLYCSLNRDAATLARLGQTDQAQILVSEAQALEKTTASRLVTEVLTQIASESAAFGTRPQDSWEAFERVIPASTDASSALRELSMRVMNVRIGTPAIANAESVSYGVVRTVRDAFAEVEITGGGVLAVPTRELRERGLDRVGAPVEVRIAHLGKGRALIETEPALLIEGLQEPSGRFDPFAMLSAPATPAEGHEIARVLETLPNVRIISPLPVSR